MRGLEQEEEDLEEAVSHLSIYLRGLDHLYQEQAQQLKQQIDRAERAEQRIELERVKTTIAEVERHNMAQDYLREKNVRRGFTNSYGMSSKGNVEGEGEKPTWMKKNPKKLTGTKGPRLKMRYWSRIFH
jgi:hypothetical protein